MNVPTDFFALYRELRIDPACTPEDFKRAYRRRVAELHPDRSRDHATGEEALKTLNLGYAAALEFFDVHGRFPGAPAIRPAQHAPAPRPGVAAGAPRSSGSDRGDDPPPAAGQRWLRLVLIALALVFAVSQIISLSSGGEDADTAEGAPAPPPPTRGTDRSPAPEGRLSIGMSSLEVLSLFGAPTDATEDGQHWHYGPSWIRIACTRVRDWYSSPLKPLGTSRIQPAPETRTGDDPPRHCVDHPPALRPTG